MTLNENSLNEAAVSAPTTDASRIDSLDVLRGFALLGILVMNIQSFAMVESAYMNPSVLGPVEGVEGAVWLTTHLLADSKFISIFSMLFGAGIVLMAERRVAIGKSAAALHYRRLLGLLVIGLIHSYLLWHGDILVSYAVCGAIVFFAWRWSPKRQLLVATLLLVFGAGLIRFFDWSIPYWGEQALEEVRSNQWRPNAESIEKELTTYRGPWSGLFARRVKSVMTIQFYYLPLFMFWHISGLMLIGMALYKTGILTGDCQTRAYRRITITGLVIGLPLTAAGAVWNYQANWKLESSMFDGMLPNYFGSLAAAIGYIGALMLLLQTPVRDQLTRWLAPVGRTALTNYLAQTVICTTLFYGHGLGWFGSVSRVQQLLIVAVIWCVQIAASRWWMARYRLGPIEYIWRTLTYGARPPMRRSLQTLSR